MDAVVLVSIHESLTKEAVKVNPFRDAIVREWCTGFVVKDDGVHAYVVTCAHLLDRLPTNNSLFQLQAGGKASKMIVDGRDDGIDLAIIQVESFGPNKSAVQMSKATKGPFRLPGYVNLIRNEFARETVSGVLQQLDEVCWHNGARPTKYWSLSVGKKSPPLKKGFSGSPVLNAKKQVVAVARLLTADGRAGHAIGIESLTRIWPTDAFGDLSKKKSAAIPRDSDPPTPPPIVNPDDPQKGRWPPHQREVDGRRLSVDKIQLHGGRYFSFNAYVESTDDTELQSPVVFHLHDTFARQTIWIRRIREGRRAVLEEVDSYGVFTLAAQVKRHDGQWVSLELDLQTLSEIPEPFKSR